jgi:anti-anti-sigma regulatory factor
LHCRGEEERITQPFRRRALARAMKAHGDVTVDLSELVFADTSLMLDLAALARRLRGRGFTLYLHAPQRQVRILIELVGLNRLAGLDLEDPASVLT